MAQDIDRIRDEMAKLPAGSPVAMVGDYCTRRVMAGAAWPKTATLAEAFKMIRDAARKRAVKGAACVSDEEAFAIVDKYAGWQPETSTHPQASADEAKDESTGVLPKPLPPMTVSAMDDLAAMLEDL